MAKSTLFLASVTTLLSAGTLHSAPSKAPAKAPAPTKSVVKPAPTPSLSDAPFDIAAGKVPLNYYGHNVKRLYETLSARITPKGEYETTEAYKARMDALSHTTLFGTLKADSDLAFVTGTGSKYNADRKVMELQFYIAAPTIGVASMSRSNDEGVFPTNSETLSETTYPGENKFGVKRQVTKTVSKNYPIFLTGWAALPLKKSEHGSSAPEGRLDIPMDVETAKAVKGNLKLVLIYNLQYPYVQKDVDYTRATVDFPYESETRSYYVRGVLKGLWVYNGKTGEVITRLAPENVAAQAESPYEAP